MVPNNPLHVRLDSYRDVRVRVHCEETVSDLTDVLHKLVDIVRGPAHELHAEVDKLDPEKRVAPVDEKEAE
jgi:hypothetical protein